MTLRHFNIFLCVCREKNMTKAAEKLYMTQPSVTQAIKELEEYYNCELFDRTGKRITINKNGYKLIPLAEQCIKLFENIESTMREESEKIELRIGASVTVGTYFLKKIIANIQEEKNIEIRFKIDNTKTIERMILEAEIDIGIVEGEITSKYIQSIPFMEDELVLISSINNEISKMSPVSINRLDDMKFIFREEGSGTKAIIEDVFEKYNVKVDCVGNIASIEAIKNMVASDYGISIIPKISVTERELSEIISIVEIKNVKLKRSFKIVYHKEREKIKYIKNIIYKIKEGSY